MTVFFHFVHPRLAYIDRELKLKPGVWLELGRLGGFRILPIAAPHGYNEKREDVLFQMPNWLRTLGFVRDPDFVVGGRDRPYLQRWWILPRNKWFSIYLHRFLRSDDDRALHDHPWRNLSIILKGRYIEEVPDLDQAPTIFTRLFELPRKRLLRRRFSLIWRRQPTDSHRIELVNGEPVLTLFICGRVLRTWGFHCRQGWIPWRQFVGEDPGEIGAGCGEHTAGRFIDWDAYARNLQSYARGAGDE